MGYFIEVAYIFFSVVSFMIYKALSIEDMRKYKHLDFLMILLLSVFTSKLISVVNSEVSNVYLLNIIYLLLSLIIGFSFALIERVFYHKIVPYCIDFFSEHSLNSKDLDSDSIVLIKVLERVYRAIFETKKMPVDKVRIEITLKNDRTVEGYLSGHSKHDINLESHERDKDHKRNNVVVTNISKSEIQKIRIVVDERYKDCL